MVSKELPKVESRASPAWVGCQEYQTVWEMAGSKKVSSSSTVASIFVPVVLLSDGSRGRALRKSSFSGRVMVVMVKVSL